MPLATRLTRLTSRMGLDTEKVAPGAWLVRKGASRITSRPMVPGEQVGSLVYDPRRARRASTRVHRYLSYFMLEEQVAAILRKLDVNCVIDGGANVGRFGAALREAGYKGRIASFEPVDEFAEKLRKRSAGDRKWHVYQHALGDENTTAVINTTPGAPLSSLLPATSFGKEWSSKLEDTVEQEIAIRRLDSVLDEVLEGIDEPRMFLKLDTQGYDLMAFRGAGERLKDIVAMQSEISCLPLYEGMPELEEQLGAYRAEGFALAGMFPVAIHRQTFSLLEFDAVLVRREAFSASRA